MALRFDPRRRQALAAQILIAMGIAPAATGAACGGLAVVDADGAGASGSTGPSSVSTTAASSVSSTGTGGFTCNVPVGMNQELVYGCFDPSEHPNAPPCPAASDDNVRYLLDTKLGGPCTDASCWCYPPEDPSFCGCSNRVYDVPCGPDPAMTDRCCYYALVVTEEICEGRPFEIGGHARTATRCRRDDWSATLSPPAVAEMDAKIRRALADAWTADALAEHASIASFARFALELLAVGAPADLVRDAQRAAADEVRHAELCFALASAYAGEPVGPGALAIEGGLDERKSLADIAAATVREGCVNETLAALCARAACDAATDPVVRAALAEIADDESVHAALAWRFVAWAAAKDARAAAAVAAAFAGTVAGGSAYGGASHGHDIVLRAHGQLSAHERRAVVIAGLRDVVLPCARALLDARRDACVRALDCDRAAT